MFRSVLCVCRLSGPRHICRIAALAACLSLFGCRSLYNDTYYDYDPSTQSGLTGWGSAQRWSADRGDLFATTNQGMDIRGDSDYK